MSCREHSPAPQTTFIAGEFEDPIHRFGAGGYATMFETMLTTCDPPMRIAIKIFSPRQGEETDNLRKKIENELRIWRILHAINSPNVAPFLGVITEYNKYEEFYLPPWPVTEYYAHKSLSNFLRTMKPRRLGRFLLLRAVISGLIHVHNQRIVHGDLKADNILVDDTGVAKICDFGTSRIDCLCGPKVENQYGTIPFDSPELFEDNCRTKASDMWAFGCLALEVQFGKFPYVADYIQVYNMMKAGLPPANRDSIKFRPNDQISTLVWQTIETCWTKSPTDRITTQTVSDQFEEFLMANILQPVADS